MERCVVGIADERTSFISFRARIVDYSGFRLRAGSGAGEASGDRRWSVVGHTALRRHAEPTARVSHRTRTRVFVWLAVDADRRRHAFYREVYRERAVSHYSRGDCYSHYPPVARFILVPSSAPVGGGRTTGHYRFFGPGDALCRYRRAHARARGVTTGDVTPFARSSPHGQRQSHKRAISRRSMA